MILQTSVSRVFNQPPLKLFKLQETPSLIYIVHMPSNTDLKQLHAAYWPMDGNVQYIPRDFVWALVPWIKRNKSRSPHIDYFMNIDPPSYVINSWEAWFYHWNVACCALWRFFDIKLRRYDAMAHGRFWETAHMPGRRISAEVQEMD